MTPVHDLNAPRQPAFEAGAVRLPFGWDDLADAWRAWGCNCGPSALAAACGIPLDCARGALPTFEAKRYTSPGMMRDALDRLGAVVVRDTRANGPDKPVRYWSDGGEPRYGQTFPVRGMVRIQWAGPWTKPGANGRWAYCYSHWVAAFYDRAESHLVFDVNSGLTTRRAWESEVPPAITREIPRATGEWWATHIWWLAPCPEPKAKG